MTEEGKHDTTVHAKFDCPTNTELESRRANCCSDLLAYTALATNIKSSLDILHPLFDVLTNKLQEPLNQAVFAVRATHQSVALCSLAHLLCIDAASLSAAWLSPLLLPARTTALWVSL